MIMGPQVIFAETFGDTRYWFEKNKNLSAEIPSHSA